MRPAHATIMRSPLLAALLAAVLMLLVLMPGPCSAQVASGVSVDTASAPATGIGAAGPELSPSSPRGTDTSTVSPAGSSAGSPASGSTTGGGSTGARSETGSPENLFNAVKKPKILPENDKPPVKFTKTNLTAITENFGTGGNMRTVDTNYKTLVKVFPELDDNTWLRYRGYAATEVTLGLNAASLVISALGFIVSEMQIIKDIIAIVQASNTIATASIGLLVASPVGRTIVPPTTPIKGQGAGDHRPLRPRRLISTSADPADDPSPFKTVTIEEVHGHIDRLDESEAMLHMIDGALDKISGVVKNNGASVNETMDLLTGDKKFVGKSSFGDRDLEQVGLERMGPSLAPKHKGPKKVKSPPKRQDASSFIRNVTKQPRPNDGAVSANFVKYITAFPGTNLTSLQILELRITAARITVANSILGETAQLITLSYDLLAFALRFPAFAIQTAVLGINLGAFERALERDHIPGGAGYNDISKYLNSKKYIKYLNPEGTLADLLLGTRRKVRSAWDILEQVRLSFPR